MKQLHPLFSYAASSGVTITQIAKRAGCSRMTLYRLIRGEQNATIELLRNVSAATDNVVPIDAFLQQGNASYD